MPISANTTTALAILTSNRVSLARLLVASIHIDATSADITDHANTGLRAHPRQRPSSYSIEEEDRQHRSTAGEIVACRLGLVVCGLQSSCPCNASKRSADGRYTEFK
jgi:hypothetical protein